MTSKTINYYENNAKAFHDRTINVDMLENYQAFLKYLPNNSHILDAGCGVGRDAKYFLSCGYNVTAFDASKEMVNMATKETGLKVLQLTFQCINFFSDFDGVWANASLLHIPYIETQEIYQKIHRALKPDGIFYASYKYGCDYMPTSERDFWNMNETKIQPYFDGLFDIISMWSEKDVINKLSPSKDQTWLRFIVRKK